MTEIQQYNPTAQVGTIESRASGTALIREAAEVMATAKALADAICNTSMVPQHFRNKPEECAAAMLYGASLGFDPMQSVKAIYVVNGNAALYAAGMAAVVRRDGHELRDVEVSDTSVTVAGRRRGSSEWIERTWSIERAKTAGYTTNKRYDTNPQQMLHAKATSEVCRVMAPDSLAGVYSVEEYEMEHVAGSVVHVEQVRPTKGLAGALAQPQPEPAEPAKSTRRRTTKAEQPDGLTQEQSEKIGELMAGLGITERTNALAYVIDTIGRQIESRLELTFSEAERVIASLEKDAHPEAADQ